LANAAAEEPVLVAGVELKEKPENGDDVAAGAAGVADAAAEAVLPKAEPPKGEADEGPVVETPNENPENAGGFGAGWALASA
jgi:hypothetical protein